MGPSEDFDWFASRDRLLEFGILRQLLDRDEISNALPELQIQKAKPENPEFSVRRLKDVLSPEQLAEGLNSLKCGTVLRTAIGLRGLPTSQVTGPPSSLTADFAPSRSLQRQILTE